MDRVILHCDCNNFFASVELKKYPQYRALPVAVCGNEQARHGIVLAKNEIAKQMGVYTTQTVSQARRICPNLVILEPHYDEYEKYSLAVREIFSRYTDQIEPFGIDEAWLDVTASQRLFGSGEQIAERIRFEVKRELGITVSIGVSFNKVFAKLGSDYKKPDAITVLLRENYHAIIDTLPVSNLLFAGKTTTKALEAMGIRTIGELASAEDTVIERKIGKIGRMLLSYARGKDGSPVCAVREDPKSISNGHTFPRDLLGFEELRGAILWLCEDLGTKLRRQSMMCTTVTLRIKDPSLIVYSRQTKLNVPTDITETIAEELCMLMRSLWRDDAPVRAITVAVSSLVQKDSVATQLDFFGKAEQESHEIKQSKKESTVDQIRDKFGHDAIGSANVFLAEQTRIPKK